MLRSLDVNRRRLSAALAGAAALLPAAAPAEGEHSPPGGGGQAEGKDDKAPRPVDFAKLPAAEKWARRFPQPVLVSDLIGRQMLDRDQGVLGHVQSVVTAPDGELHITFARRRLFVLRGDTVVVPNVIAALLGPFVMLPDATDEEIAKLPAYQPAAFRPVDTGSRIRMALTKN